MPGWTQCCIGLLKNFWPHKSLKNGVAAMPPTVPVSSGVTESPRGSRRAPWRQRLIEAERGLSHGLRGDCTLFVYLFLDCLLIAVGVIFRLSSAQWIVVGTVLTLVLTAELLSQALRALISELKVTHPTGRWDPILHMATAAVTVAIIGGSCLVAAVYWQRIRDLYGL